MEFHNDISQKNILIARKELDKYFLNPPAENQLKVLNDDGMKIKIAQDNNLDKLINLIDSRRIILEKKAAIINEYYGDSLIAKDVFKDYLKEKKYYAGTANLLSAALLGANLYSRVMKNSVFMGKLGSVITIIGLQTMMRHLSNNSLEKTIERPWKIHSHRMEKGMGPTNYAGNCHIDKLVSSTAFGVKII